MRGRFKRGRTAYSQILHLRPRGSMRRQMCLFQKCNSLPLPLRHNHYCSRCPMTPLVLSQAPRLPPLSTVHRQVHRLFRNAQKGSRWHEVRNHQQMSRRTHLHQRTPCNWHVRIVVLGSCGAVSGTASAVDRVTHTPGVLRWSALVAVLSGSMTSMPVPAVTARSSRDGYRGLPGCTQLLVSSNSHLHPMMNKSPDG